VTERSCFRFPFPTILRLLNTFSYPVLRFVISYHDVNQTYCGESVYILLLGWTLKTLQGFQLDLVLMFYTKFMERIFVAHRSTITHTSCQASFASCSHSLTRLALASLQVSAHRNMSFIFGMLTYGLAKNG
jgi:hypothetical protein